jgi:hypothetical protein
MAPGREPVAGPGLDDLVRGRTQILSAWVLHGRFTGSTAWIVLVLVAGTAACGAAMGIWRAPKQGLFTALKLPLILLLTTTGNAFVNAMLAPLLGMRLTLWQSFKAVLLSFALAGTILGALAPLGAFLAWNMPAYDEPGLKLGTIYSLFLLFYVGVIAFAGVAANVMLVRLLEHLAGSPAVARRVLLAWLACNLLLGGQLSWIARPFFGSPGLDVQFLRPNALDGNFFEAVYHAMARLFS